VRSVVQLYPGPHEIGLKGFGRGDVAQLGERRTCTAEAVGSNPIISIFSRGWRLITSMGFAILLGIVEVFDN
jgi:hypothetical protein